MGSPRFFTAEEVTAGALVALDTIDAHHASSVLRAKGGEPLTLLSAGVAWDAQFDAIGRNGVTARVVRRSEDQSGELPIPIVVLQALTKGAKFDDVVEKTVELGATRIVPVFCARSEAEGGPIKTDRWRRIARAAAMQSRRRIMPEIDATSTWDDAVARFAEGALTLVAYEKAGKGSLASAIATYRRDNALVIAVGPEGGLEADEVERARIQGAQIVSLGPTTLRTETAAAALLAASASSLGWW
jgi:16S rRNA (uracil1498-N3)-methyltransferase